MAVQADERALCRCHMGGLVGGALAAYLLGPHYVRHKQPGGGMVDAPPIAILAHSGSARIRSSG